MCATRPRVSRRNVSTAGQPSSAPSSAGSSVAAWHKLPAPGRWHARRPQSHSAESMRPTGPLAATVAPPSAPGRLSALAQPVLSLPLPFCSPRLLLFELPLLSLAGRSGGVPRPGLVVLALCFFLFLVSVFCLCFALFLSSSWSSCSCWLVWLPTSLSRWGGDVGNQTSPASPAPSRMRLGFGIRSRVRSQIRGRVRGTSGSGRTSRRDVSCAWRGACPAAAGRPCRTERL